MLHVAAAAYIKKHGRGQLTDSIAVSIITSRVGPSHVNICFKIIKIPLETDVLSKCLPGDGS